MLRDTSVAPSVMPDGADVHSFTLLSITIIVVPEKGPGVGTVNPVHPVCVILKKMSRILLGLLSRST